MNYNFQNIIWNYFVLILCLNMKKFVFDFNDYDGSYSKLEGFINIDNFVFYTPYYIVLYSSDCEVLCGGPAIGNPIVLKFVFSYLDSARPFIDYIDYMLMDWYSNYGNYCNCTSFSCFNVINLYFIKCKDIDLQDIPYKVKCYEGINYVK